MNNITIGQYIPTNSWLHRIDPRIKIIALVILLATVFIVPLSSDLLSIITISSLMVGAFVLTISAKIPIGKVLRGLRPIVFLLTFTFFIQLLYTDSSAPPLFGPFRMSVSVVSVMAILIFLVFYHWSKKYVKFRMLYFVLAVLVFFFIQAVSPVFLEIFSYQLPIHEEGLLRSAFIFLRIVSIIVFTSLLTFTTMTTELNYGIESLLKPLKIIRFPVDMIAMMLSLTLRYIPTLLQETEKIMKAQASRGVDFKESKTKDKVIQIVSLLIPIFVISFKRAEDLGNAMEVRGYVIGDKRTKIDVYHVGLADYVTLFASVIILVGTILLRSYL